MSRIKQRISSLISGQLPEFIRTDYTTFVAFLEAYYKFLEQDQHALELVQNAASYQDIDSTASSFIQYFLKTYIPGIPANALADQKLLVKRIKDLYESKGSELSFKLLFKILYDTNVDVKHPYDFVLKPSDGVWQQRVSVKVQLTSGSASDLTNRFLTLVKAGVTYNAPINRVKVLGDGSFELFLQTNTIPPFAINDVVVVNSSTGSIFSGIILPTASGYEILAPGSGFRVGQVVNVSVSTTADTVLKITKVDINQGVKELKFINYGYGFTNEITFNLFNDLTVAGTVADINTITNSIIDSGTVYRDPLTDPQRYFDTDYVDGLYSALVVISFSSNPGGSGSTSADTTLGDDVAIIKLTLGATGRYPGQYITNKGFLSEPDVRLQDDQLYQPFAYQLESDQDISKFYDIVKSLVHPAGTNMFNNRVLLNSVNVVANISVVSTSNINTELYDVISLLDYNTKVFLKNISDQDYANTSTYAVYTLTKPLSDQINNFSDQSFITTNKVINDLISVTDELISVNATHADENATALVDNNIFTVNKNINNDISVANVTDSIVIANSDYTEPLYFSEIYVGQILVSI